MPGLTRVRRFTETRRQMFKKVVTVQALVVSLSAQVLLLLVLRRVMLLLVLVMRRVKLLVLLRALLTAPLRRVPNTRARL